MNRLIRFFDKFNKEIGKGGGGIRRKYLIKFAGKMGR